MPDKLAGKILLAPQTTKKRPEERFSSCGLREEDYSSSTPAIINPMRRTLFWSETGNRSMNLPR